MGNTLEKLTFTVLLLDKLSGPSKGVCKSMRQVQEMGQGAFQSLSQSEASIAATGRALHVFTGPAREFNRALGEVASLGVAQDELEKLGAAGKRYAKQFGGNAVEIVRSGYDIQSAIPGLAKGALAEFTYQGALLAKATQAIASDITAFQRQMYNIFKDDARRIGEAEWIENLTGKTAKAVEMFMTSGPKMKQAFANLGSVGKLLGISMDEQIAVLGTLQSAGMSDVNAGTSYKAMLTQMANASEILSLKFKGTDGSLLPMNEIIGKIQGKIEKLDKDKQVTRLTKAFGQDGAKAVMNMMGKTDELKKSIDEIARTQGAAYALTMAESLSDPLDRFNGSLNVIKTTIGQTLLPAVNLVLSLMGRGLAALQWLLDTLPPLRWLLGTVVLAVTGLRLAWRAFIALSGLRTMLQAVTGELRIMWLWCLKSAHAHGTMTAAQKLNAVVSMFWAKAVSGVKWSIRSCALVTRGLTSALTWQNTVMLAQKAGTLIYSGALWIMNGGLIAATVAAWSFTVALLACPVTWIVLAVVALAGALAALVIYWDKVCAFCKKYADYLLMMLGPIGWVIAAFRNWDKITGILGKVWEWFKKTCPNIAGLLEKLFQVAKVLFSFGMGMYKKFFGGIWDGVKSAFGAIGDFFGGIWDGITESGAGFLDWLTQKLTPAIAFFRTLFAGVGAAASAVWAGIRSSLGNIDGWIGKMLSAVSKIPGLGFLEPDQAVAPQIKTDTSVISDVTSVRRQSKDVPAGGIRNQTTNSTVNYGGVTINTTAPVGPGMLEDMYALNGGI